MLTLSFPLIFDLRASKKFLSPVKYKIYIIEDFSQIFYKNLIIFLKNCPFYKKINLCITQVSLNTLFLSLHVTALALKFLPL